MVGKFNVLVVDDEPDKRQLLATALQMAGYNVRTARDGVEGLAAVESHLPDLIILDVMMPVLDGWGVLDALKGREDRPRVIVLSAKSGTRDKARAYEAGADGYVTKPFDPDEVIRQLDHLLGMDDVAAEQHRTELVRRFAQVGG